jgi:DNA-binding transcriptional ArsR family regulator
VDAFAAVADPTRRRILDELRTRERTVGELVEALGAPQPTVSKHLRVLRDARLVVSQVDAQRRRYRVDPTGMREVDEWISAFRRLWADRLDALEAHLDRRRRR